MNIKREEERQMESSYHARLARKSRQKNSIDAQLRACKEFAERKNFVDSKHFYR